MVMNESAARKDEDVRLFYSTSPCNVGTKTACDDPFRHWKCRNRFWTSDDPPDVDWRAVDQSLQTRQDGFIADVTEALVADQDGAHDNQRRREWMRMRSQTPVARSAASVRLGRRLTTEAPVTWRYITRSSRALTE